MKNKTTNSTANFGIQPSLSAPRGSGRLWRPVASGPRAQQPGGPESLRSAARGTLLPSLPRCPLLPWRGVRFLRFSFQILK